MRQSRRLASGRTFRKTVVRLVGSDDRRAVRCMVLGAAFGLALGFSHPAMAGKSPGDLAFLPIEGDHRILVMRLAYPDLPPDEVFPLSAALQFAQELEETLEPNSYGKVTVTIDMTPVLLMPKTSAAYAAEATLARLRADAVALAEAAGFFNACYDREIILSRPQLWGGAAALGGMNYKTSWISWNANRSGYLWAHEVGHTYGWPHANFWRVPAGLPPTSPAGEEVQYGDKFDTMGDFAGFHHFNPWFKRRANWLPDAAISTVTQSGLYVIRPFEAGPDPSDAPSALRIRKDPDRDYWIFYRSQEPLAVSGPVLTWGGRNDSRASRLLDMTPGSLENDWQDAELVVGALFRDDDLGLEVFVVSIGDDARVTLDVAFDTGTQAPLDDLPIVDVLAPARSQTVAGPVTYVVTAFDPDAGTFDGAGIDRVDFAIFGGDSDGSPPIHTGSDSTPPYTLDFDPGSVPGFEDGGYALSITAVGLDGGTNTYSFKHLIDLTGPDPGIPPPPGQAGRPPEVSGVAFAGSPVTTMSWSAALYADEYDVCRGFLADLDGLDYGACQNDRDPDLTDTSFVDDEIPPVDEGFFYVVRGRNLTCPAAGSYGNLAAGGQRINQNPAACP